MKAGGPASLYRRVREILESARAGAARSVNTAQLVAYWLIGGEIVEEEQKGKAKAGYGDRLLDELAGLLVADFGKSASNNKLYNFLPELLGRIV